MEDFNDEDIIMPDEEVDTPATTEEGENVAEQTSEATQVDNEEQKVLDYLNKRGIKYNGENVTVSNMDDVIANIQKGMNYDKLKEKTDTEADVVNNYISEKAKQFGITPKEYIEKVQAYEKEKEKEQVERDIESMVSNGVSEEVARRVAETELARKEFEKERAELQKRKEEEDKREKENKEYEDFIKEHPDIKADSIPEEVFKEAKEIGLNAAYNQYENKMLKEKIKQLEQNQINASTSPVGLTSDGSPTEQESKDAFLEGFDSVL